MENEDRTNIKLSSSIYWRLLISPLSWYRCFHLLYNTKSRNQFDCIKYYSLLLIIVCLSGLWNYIHWNLTFDAGYYLRLLSSVSSSKLNISDAREQYDSLFWKTCLKTFIISVITGLMQCCNIFLSAIWRRRISDELHQLLFAFPDGYLLYHAFQSIDDLSTKLTDDIRLFTTNMGIALFGSLYFNGLIVTFTGIITFSIYVVKSTQGDTNGITICFLTFIVCVIMVTVISQKFNISTVRQSERKGQMRSYLQRIHSNAECISFYGSQLCELRYFKQLQSLLYKSNLYWSVWFSILNIPVTLLGNR